MTYTQNHHLPQWVKSDRIMMDDFNAAMARIESGMTANAQAAASAKSTANTALSSKPYVTGTYTGAGAEIKNISLGFRPSFVIISGMVSVASANDLTSFDRYFAMTAGNVLSKRVKLTSTGFTVYPLSKEYDYNPSLNETGRVYDYIAFK